MKRWPILLALLLLPLAAHATVTSTTTSVTFTCTGSTGPFAFTFPISDPTAMTVTQNGTVLASNLYTITPVNNSYGNGGSVTLVTACPNTQPLVLTRVTPLTQETLFYDNMPAPMTQFMLGLDKLTEITQEQATTLNAATCPGTEVLVSINPLQCVANGSGGGGGGGTTTFAVTFDNSNAGVAPAGVFNGGVAKLISTNTIGALSLTATGAQAVKGPLTSPRVNGIYAVDGVTYTTISAAVAAADAANGGIVTVPPGTYSDTIVVSNSNTSIVGGGMQSTTINPSGNSCAVTFAGGSGAGINYNTLKDLSIANTSSTGDGLCFTGSANVPNDRTLVTRVAVNGFRYNLNITGRAIWDSFVDDYFENATATNVYASTASVVNALEFKGGRIGGAQQYGVYFNNTNSSGTSQGISFDHVNIEYNGASGTLANCAGLYLTGEGSGQISNGSYFEGNCTTNPDGKGADIRITGTYAQAFSIRDSLIWSLTNYGILNDATQTTGTYEGNNLFAASTARIKIATTHALSAVTVGDNFLNGGAAIYTPDSGGATHVSSTYPLGTDESVVTSVTSNTISALETGHVYLNCGSCSIATITGGVAGQILYITDKAGSPVLTQGTGTNGIALSDAVNRTLSPGFSVLLTFDANVGYWVEVSNELTNLNVGNFQATGTITGFTINATNGYQYGGAAPSGHCLIGNGTVYVDSTSCGSGGGGTTPNMVITTANYTIPQTGLWVRVNCASSCTITLPSSVTTGFNTLIEMAPTSSAVTISPNGVAYDGITSQLQPGQSTFISTDGTGYHSTLPYSSLPVATQVVTAANSAGRGNLIAQSTGTSKAVAFNDYPWTLLVPAANCSNTTPATGWSLPASGAATPACRTGSNVNVGVLQFAASNTAQFQIELPSDYDSTGTVYAKISLSQASNTTSSQTIIMQMATMCPGSTDDTAFNSAQAFSTVTTNGFANSVWAPTLSAVTMTGCTAGQPLNVKISRSGADTATTSPNVYYVSITIPRAPVMQAN